MDDIDREMQKANIGKRKEEAYEQINHPKIPKTSLHPMKAKGVEGRIMKKISEDQRKASQDKKTDWSGWIVVFLIIALILVTKLLGLW